MEKIIENLKGLDWFYVREEETSYMKAIEIIDSETRIVAYRPYEDDIQSWWEENQDNLKEVIESQYDCTGRWFSAYQETEGTTLYDVQYLDV